MNKYIVGYETENGIVAASYMPPATPTAETYSEALEKARDLTETFVGDKIVITTERELARQEEGEEPIILWRSDDNKTLAAYMQYSQEGWSQETTGESLDYVKKSHRPSVYFDIDGTLGMWYADGRGLSSLEEIIDPRNHYFRDIEPHPAMIMLAEQLQEQGYDVCILSAADRGTIRDKMEWIGEHLPFVPQENIFFSPLGADKSEFVKGNADISVLIDDYPKNLSEWKGTAIKAINTVNSHQDVYPEIDLTSLERNMTEKLALAQEMVDSGIVPETAYDKMRDGIVAAMADTIKRAAQNVAQVVDELTAQVEAQSKTLGNIQEYNEYIAGGTVGSHSETKLYTQENGKYYVSLDTHDDFADLEPDPEPYEVSYEEIVADFAEAMQHTNEFEDVYSGGVDEIATDVVTYHFADEQLEKDVLDYIAAQKELNNQKGAENKMEQSNNEVRQYQTESEYGNSHGFEVETQDGVLVRIETESSYDHPTPRMYVESYLEQPQFGTSDKVNEKAFSEALEIIAESPDVPNSLKEWGKQVQAAAQEFIQSMEDSNYETATINTPRGEVEFTVMGWQGAASPPQSIEEVEYYLGGDDVVDSSGNLYNIVVDAVNYEKGERSRENEVERLQAFYEEKVAPFIDKPYTELTDEQNEARGFFSDWHKDVYGHRPHGDRNECEKVFAAKQVEAHENDYRMLDRLQSDVKYFLGEGGHNENTLWAKNVEHQIAEMQRIYNTLPVKPDWLPQGDIKYMAQKMVNAKYKTDAIAEAINEGLTNDEVLVSKVSEEFTAETGKSGCGVNIILSMNEEGLKQLYDRACLDTVTGKSADEFLKEGGNIKAECEVFKDGSAVMTVLAVGEQKCEGYALLSETEQAAIKAVVEAQLGNIEQYIANNRTDVVPIRKIEVRTDEHLHGVTEDDVAQVFLSENEPLLKALYERTESGYSSYEEFTAEGNVAAAAARFHEDGSVSMRLFIQDDLGYTSTEDVLLSQREQHKMRQAVEKSLYERIEDAKDVDGRKAFTNILKNVSHSPSAAISEHIMPDMTDSDVLVDDNAIEVGFSLGKGHETAMNVMLNLYDAGYEELYKAAGFEAQTGIDFHTSLEETDDQMYAYAILYADGTVGMLTTLDGNEYYLSQTIALSTEEQMKIKELIEDKFGNVELFIANTLSEESERNIGVIAAESPLEWSWETNKVTHEGMEGYNVQLVVGDDALDEIMQRTGAYQTLGLKDFEEYLNSSIQLAIDANVGKDDSVTVQIYGDYLPKAVVPLTADEKETVYAATNACLEKEGLHKLGYEDEKSDKVEGLSFIYHNDGSGSAELNGEVIGSYVYIMGEMQFSGEEPHRLTEGVDMEEFKSMFKELSEDRALEKHNAKEIKAPEPKKETPTKKQEGRD